MTQGWVPSLILVVVVGVAVSGCRPACQPVAHPSDPAQELASLLAGIVGDRSVVRGAALVVDAPALAINWRHSAGFADPDAAIPMTPATPVRIASNTKTYVAVAVLRLVEQGRLGLDDPIGARLPADIVSLLASDGYDTGRMLVRHLLTHTSGLFDHTGGPHYGERIVAAPTHRWTPHEQVALAVELGAPHGAPGEVFTYCDTGYVLLGLILERATGQTLAAAVRELVGFERLGLASTWWESLEPEPAGLPARAHQLLGDLDTYGFEPHFDLHGGGGLVASIEDLARFMRALGTGDVFAQPATLDTMLAPVEGARALPDAAAGTLPPGAYRMGIWRIEIEGLEAWRHTGFWGTSATWVPTLDLVVTATVNQHEAKAALDEITTRAILLARQVHTDSPATGHTAGRR